MQTPEELVEYLTLRKHFDGGLPEYEEQILTKLLRETDGTVDNPDNRYYCDACHVCKLVEELDRENTLLSERVASLQRELAMALGNDTRYIW